MPIICHCRDCKVLLVFSPSHVRSAIASTELYLYLTFLWLAQKCSCRRTFESVITRLAQSYRAVYNGTADAFTMSVYCRTSALRHVSLMHQLHSYMRQCHSLTSVRGLWMAQTPFDSIYCGFIVQKMNSNI